MRLRKKIGMAIVTVAMAAVFAPAAMAATPVIATDVTEPADGNILVGVEGTYYAQVNAAVDRINEIREEAYKEGLSESYVPIKWSGDLEYISRIRAAESSLTMGHERTNGTSCFYISSSNGVRSSAENIAWNFGTSMLSAIEQWYGEKSDLVNKTGRETGHYTSMINPKFKYFALGTFCTSKGGYYNTTVGSFSGASSLDETPMSFTGDCIQTLEVKKDNTTLSVGGKSSVVSGATTTLSMAASAKFTEGIATVTANNLKVLSPATWSSSNTGVATISSTGAVKGIKRGQTTITGTVAGMKASKTFAVTIPTKATVKSANYKISDNGITATATYVGLKSKKAKSVTIPATVKVAGVTCKVTAIGAKAFSGCKKLTKVTIGKNVTKIGKQAFQNCKKLKKVTFKTKSLKSIGSKAFKGISKKASFKTPKKKKASYSKMIKKAKAPKTVKVK